MDTASAALGTVLVDVVEPGVALITIAGLSLGARVGRVGDAPRQFYVEDDGTERIVATARGYREAGERFAAHHDVDWPLLVVEDETTGKVRTYVR